MPESSAPSPRRPPWWLPAYAAGWVAIGLWLGLNAWIGHRGDDEPAWHLFVWELSSALVMGLLALGVARFERRWHLTGPGAWRRWPLHALAAVAFSLAHVVLIIALRKLAYAVAGQQYDFGPLALGLFYEFQKDLMTYASIVTVCALLREMRERRQRQIDELTLRQALSEARLAHLSAQIEPHFVFNTLNAIANRMYEDVAAADRLLVALADLLRAAMTADGSDFVTLADEARWLHAYGALMSERQPGLLAMQVEVEPGLEHARLPRLLLQPLVENAFRHGLRNGRGRIRVSVDRHGPWLRCRVEDDGIGLPAEPSPGVGLANVQQRLALLYPGRHRWSIGPGRERGTAVVVELPLERAA